jgi:hypothetical protein
MSFFRRSQPRVTVAQLMSWAQAQVALGVPRQAICQGWLSHACFSRTPEERESYSQAERQLFGEMVARNLRGAELERRGCITEAMEEYEANLNDRFLGAHPYQRLQALYLARGDYDSALRVSRTHLRILASSRPPIPPNGRAGPDADLFDL